MRQDATIDRRQVYCPNSSWLAYSKGTAKAGYFVVWNDNGNMRLCRVIGRVHYAPASGEVKEIKDWLFLAVLNDSATSVWIRWVPPSEITNVYSPEDYATMRHSKAMDLFHSADFLKNSPEGIAAILE